MFIFRMNLKTQQIELDDKAQLEVVRDMLSRTRGNVQQNSIFYLLWGWLVFAATVLQYVFMTQLHWNQFHMIPWIILMPAGGAISFWIGRRMEERANYTTLLDRVMGYLWGGITVGILFSLFLSMRLGWANSYILVILFYGIGAVISGLILKFRPLIIGGVFSLLLIAAVLAFPVLIEQFSDMLLLLAISIVATYLIPGYLLRRKKESHV